MSNIIGLASAFVELVPAFAKWFDRSDQTADAKASLSQKVIDIAQKISNKRSPQNALKHLLDDPKALLEFQRTMVHLQHDMERALYEDRQSARKRDISFVTAGRQNVRADVMVCAAALGLIGCLGCLILLKGQLPGEAVGIMSTIAGIFGACLKDAYAFEFGSSRSSRLKDFLYSKE